MKQPRPTCPPAAPQQLQEATTRPRPSGCRTRHRPPRSLASSRQSAAAHPLRSAAVEQFPIPVDGCPSVLAPAPLPASRPSPGTSPPRRKAAACGSAGSRAEMNPSAPSYPTASLHVGDLHPDGTAAMRGEKLSPAGPIPSIRVCRDTVTGRSSGCAYVASSSRRPGACFGRHEFWCQEGQASPHHVASA